MGTSVNKTGIVLTEDFSDFAKNPYDKTIYTEPDGTVWIRVAHHNNPASGLFQSGADFDNKVYIDENRWFYVSLTNQIKSGK